MLDFPQEHLQTELEYFAATRKENSHTMLFPIPVIPVANTAALLLKAEAIVKEFGGFFKWSDVCLIIQKCFVCVKEAGVDVEDEAKNVFTMLQHAFNVTDKTFLAFYTSPLFKAIAPSFVSLVNNILNTSKIAPTTVSTTPPTEQDIQNFVATMKKTITASGVTWTDVPAYLIKTIEFIQGYTSLTSAQQEQYVVTVLEDIVGVVDFPHIPAAISTPVFDELIPPFVTFIFDEINAATAPAPTPAKTPTPAPAVAPATS